MSPKEQEQHLAGAIDALRRLNLALGKAEGIQDRVVTVSTRDLRLAISNEHHLSKELLRYRVTTPEPRDPFPDPLATKSANAKSQSTTAPA